MKYYTIDFRGKAHEIKKSRFVSAFYREDLTDCCLWYSDGNAAFLGDGALDTIRATTAIIKTLGTFSIEAVQIGVTDEEYKVFEKANEFTHGGSDNIIIITDKYNRSKSWLIKRDKSRHYFLNQAVNGTLRKKWERVGKAYIQAVLNVKNF